MKSSSSVPIPILWESDGMWLNPILPFKNLFLLILIPIGILSRLKLIVAERKCTQYFKKTNLFQVQTFYEQFFFQIWQFFSVFCVPIRDWLSWFVLLFQTIYYILVTSVLSLLGLKIENFYHNWSWRSRKLADISYYCMGNPNKMVPNWSTNLPGFQLAIFRLFSNFKTKI